MSRPEKVPLNGVFSLSASIGYFSATYSLPMISLELEDFLQVQLQLAFDGRHATTIKHRTRK